MPSLQITGFNTVLLVLSSVTAIIAERSVKQYSTLEFHAQSDAYGSFFYLITGLHGAHVALGLFMLLYVAIRAFAGHFDRVRHSAVRNAILYWHFVDVVWLVVFTTLYLLPRMR